MEIFLIALLTLISGIVGTITGFGTSTIMIPILVMFLPPIEAIFLISIIHWFGSLWKVLLFRSGLDWRLFMLFGLSGLVASYSGASLALNVEHEMLLRLLGIFLCIYSLSLLIKTDMRMPADAASAVAGGILSGFFAGIFGIGGAIRSAFLLAFNLPKAVYIATIGAIGLVVDSTRVITYILGGTSMEYALWWGLLLFIPISFVGARIAKNIVHRIPQSHFRLVIAWYLLLLGLKLLIAP